jgi:hypothetical protein
MLAAQIVGMIGKAFTADESQEKPKEPPRATPRKKRGTTEFLKGGGFEIG